MSRSSRLIDILQLFENGQSVWTVDDISQELGISVSTAYRHLRVHLDAARALRGEVPKDALAALLPATLATRDLKRLAGASHNVFDRRVAASGLGRKLRLVVAAATGRY